MLRRSRSFVAALLSLGCLAWAVPPTVEVELVDLSESGELFAFPPVSGAAGTLADPARVRVLPGMDWDAPEIEVRGATPGTPLFLLVEDLDAAARPEATFGGFQWTPLTEHPVAGATRRLFEVLPARDRFTVRLWTPSTPPQEAPYYTYAQFVSYMQGIEESPLVQIDQVGTSIQGRPLLRVVVDDPGFSGPKKTVLMVVRQHGNEYGSSYVLEGALDYLLQRGAREFQSGVGARAGGRQALNPITQANLRRTRFIIYPLFNPDGAVANQRGNANGVDLNRDWESAGPNGGQQPETFAIQSDVEDFEAQYGIQMAGDHHGWGNAVHGGYRYANGLAPSSVSGPEYFEAFKDTWEYTQHDPTQVGWQENGGTVGMMRVELFQRHGFLVHTPEYNGSISTAEQFRAKGRGWIMAMVDAAYAPRFVTASGLETAQVDFAAGVFVRVDDRDENAEPGGLDTVSVTVSSPTTGDSETITLTETGTNTSLFQNLVALPLTTAASAAEDGVLQATSGARLVVVYTDDDYARDTSDASAKVR